MNTHWIHDEYNNNTQRKQNECIMHTQCMHHEYIMNTQWIRHENITNRSWIHNGYKDTCGYIMKPWWTLDGNMMST